MCYFFGLLLGSSAGHYIGRNNERMRMNDIVEKYKNESIYKSKIISQYNRFLLKNNFLDEYDLFIKNDSEIHTTESQD